MAAVKLTRRAALAAAAASGVAIAPLPPHDDSAPAYRGSLDGFESKVNMADFDPVFWTRKRWDSSPLRLTFREDVISSRRQALAWQARLRPKLQELIGGFAFAGDRGAPLAPMLLEKREFDGYSREKFVYTSQPGVQVLAYLLSPRIKGPTPVMVCVPGHGRGVDDIVGIDAHGQDRNDKSGYQRDFAIQVVESGMAALAIEPLAFGCRRDPATKQSGYGAACQPVAGAALLFGETMIAWRVWDIMRAIDWLATRPKELDASRVGCMGISGGGTCTVFAAALEPRIKVAMVSGYLNTFRDSILSIAHCIDNYVPGILNWCEMYDVAGLIAPRPLFIESGDKDSTFPVEASVASYEKVRRVYKAMGAGSAIEQEVFEGEHSFHGRRGIPFLKAALDA